MRWRGSVAGLLGCQDRERRLARGPEPAPVQVQGHLAVQVEAHLGVGRWPFHALGNVASQVGVGG
eukprot:12246509-Prorocentrum_lima.AAC.1